jgi:hypothetical protein
MVVVDDDRSTTGAASLVNEQEIIAAKSQAQPSSCASAVRVGSSRRSPAQRSSAYSWCGRATVSAVKA